MPDGSNGRLFGASVGKALSMVGPEIAAIDQPYHSDDLVESTFFSGNGIS
jgi:hypothetical protein